MLTNYTIGDNRYGSEFDRYMLDRTTIKLVSRDTRSAGSRLVVVLAGLLVEGSSLLDGAEAGDAEGLTGLGDGLGPAADVLERALAGRGFDRPTPSLVGVVKLGNEPTNQRFRIPVDKLGTSPWPYRYIPKLTTTASTQKHGRVTILDVQKVPDLMIV